MQGSDRRRRRTRVEGGVVSRRLSTWLAVGGAAGGKGSTGQAQVLAGLGGGLHSGLGWLWAGLQGCKD